MYAIWTQQYQQETQVPIRFEASSSSVGVKQVVARAVDFGATDVPLSAQDLARHGLVQFPTLVGGLVPVVNLPGIGDGRLRLSAAVLAAIFAGRITQWDDPAIADLNSGLALPARRIVRVVRGDGSGTSEVFIRFLQQTAPAAAAALDFKAGRASWPGTPVATQSSKNLADTVRDTPGAIGYISFDYAQRENLNTVSLRNRRGEWMAASVRAFAAASRAAGLFKDSLEAAPLLDVDGLGVWPIVTATYVLVPREPASALRAGHTLNFFVRSFMLGDRAVAGTGFAPLPVTTQARIVRLLTDLRTRNGELIPVLGDRTRATPGATQAAPAR